MSSIKSPPSVVLNSADRRAEKERSRQRDMQDFNAKRLSGNQIARRNSIISPEAAHQAKVIFA